MAMIHASLNAPMSLWTWGRVDGSTSTSGVGSPSSIASVPRTWTTLACTSHPGSAVGRFQSAWSGAPAS